MDSKPERRKKYESKSVKLGKALAKLGFTANAMTALSVIIALIGLYYVGFKKNLLAGLLVFTLSVVMDIFDGAIARATGTASKYGTMVDRIADRIVEFLIVFSLALGSFLERRIAMLTYFSMILPSYTRILGEKLFGVSGLSKGLMERKEKLGTLLLGTILYMLNVEYPFPYFDRINLSALIVAVGSLITTAQRMRFYSKVAR